MWRRTIALSLIITWQLTTCESRSLGSGRRSFLEGSQEEASPPPQDFPLEPDGLSPDQPEAPTESPPTSLSPDLPPLPSPEEPSPLPSPAAVPSPFPGSGQPPTSPSPEPEPSPQPPISPTPPQPVPPPSLPPPSASPDVPPSPPAGASPSPLPAASPSPSPSPSSSSPPLAAASPSPGSPSPAAAPPSNSPALPGSPAALSPPPGQSPSPAQPSPTPSPSPSRGSPAPLPTPLPVPLPMPSSPTTTPSSPIASPSPSPAVVASPAAAVTPAASPRPLAPASPPLLLPLPDNPGAPYNGSHLSYTPGAAPLPMPPPLPPPTASAVPVPASPPASIPCGYGVAPFCRLYVEDALCDAQEGLISPRPWLELDIFCSQSVLEPIDPRCLVVEGPFNATLSYNLCYVASWVDSDPGFTGLATVSINTSLPGCSLATYGCTADDGEQYSHARAPKAVGVLIQNDADFASMETCAASSWQLDNLAWTDINASSQPVTCQQLPFSQLPPSILTGGWVGLQGTDSCPMTLAELPVTAAGTGEGHTMSSVAPPTVLAVQEGVNSPAARRLLQSSPMVMEPLPQCSNGVEPFCRLFVEDALCNSTQGLLTAKPYLEVDILCSQFTLTGIPSSCLTVQGPSSFDSWFNLRYQLSWENTQPDYLGWVVVSLNTSAPGCDLAVDPCSLGAGDYYNARAPAPVPVMVTNPEAFASAAARLENSWELNNLAWTDVNASSQPVNCQQQAFGKLPPTFVDNGGWISYQGVPNAFTVGCNNSTAANPSVI